MENKQYKQISETIKALQTELSPIFEEVYKLKLEISKLNEGDGRQPTPLIDLVTRITKTARRHDIENKIKLDGDEYTIGTNHNGLGYQESYSSQLTELTNTYYGDSVFKERLIREILFDSGAVIDLTAIIKKSNQKTFMRVVKALQKYNLKIPFEKFRNKQINNIEIPTEQNYSIIINIDSYSYTAFSIYSGDKRLRSLAINNEEYKPAFKIQDENIEVLKEISPTDFSDLSVRDIKIALYIIKHKETIINQIKANTTLLKSVVGDYNKERKELNELLEPFLALEKL